MDSATALGFEGSLFLSVSQDLHELNLLALGILSTDSAEALAGLREGGGGCR